VKLFGFEITRKQHVLGVNDALQQLIAAQSNFIYGSAVTPENCMQSPTVHAIVTAVSRRFAVTPVHVYQKGTSNGRDSKEKLPNHPVSKLLQAPNSWQTKVDFWQDATSWYLRYGNFFAYKSRGSTGPIRELLPIAPHRMTVEQNDEWQVTYKADGVREIPQSKMLHARGPARNGFLGDSPVNDIKTAIALDIAAEKFGQSFFENGAMPLIIFGLQQGSSGFKTDEEKEKFKADFQEKFGGKNKFKGMVLPKGFDKPFSLPIENDKAQFLETRKYQRTVIAGAFGVPPHLVGDLERATFNNVEQQDSDFTLNVIMPIGRSIEAALERDLLTPEDRNSGIIIRFNFDAILRADFKSRQEGLQIQRRNGVISPNEWREIESMNPIAEEDGGDEYIHESNMVAGKTPELEQVAPDEPTET
jgi:HK97 family phage portal protein